MSFDVIIVGARCAGASLATLLARRGARVLAVDRDGLPSDQVRADVSFADRRTGYCPRCSGPP